MEKSQRRVADYPLHRLSNQPVFQTEIPPTASVQRQRTDRAKKKALLRLAKGATCVGPRLACAGFSGSTPAGEFLAGSVAPGGAHESAIGQRRHEPGA